DEWDGAYPGRFVPLAIIPTWDSGLAVDEIRRVAAKGCSAITMPELPHIEGLPSYHDMTHWGPVLEALCDAGVVMCCKIGQGFGGRLPSEVFREHSLACYVSDPTSLKLRHDIGIDIIAWECDYPHSDSLWPDAPEQVNAELLRAGATDDDIHKITWQNACRFFHWDPFSTVPREQATVGALRSQAADVDPSI